MENSGNREGRFFLCTEQGGASPLVVRHATREEGLQSSQPLLRWLEKVGLVWDLRKVPPHKLYPPAPPSAPAAAPAQPERIPEGVA